MNVTDLIKSTLEEVQNLMLTRTVVGEPITIGDHTIIPVSKRSEEHTSELQSLA